MAHEDLIVIGFGVALAVVSVSLFLAHVKRISAPNKADPAGTLVSIDLAAALAEDQITAQRKATSKRSKASSRINASVNKHSSDVVPAGSLRERDSSSTSPCIAKAVPLDRLADKQAMLVPPPSVSSSTMVLPSPIWAEAFVKHANSKKKRLGGMVKRGERGAGWEATWERLPPPRRRRVLVAVREELVHAVSHYVGQDERLFDALCPELQTNALEEEHRATTGFSRLMRRCLDGKLLEPRSRAFSAVQQALAEVASEGHIPKDKRGPVRVFLGTFRKLCAYSFCIGVLEAVASGRADGSAGPTIGSVCAALIKTGGSGILLWAFFHGLNRMSATNLTEGDAATGLAAGESEEGGSFLMEKGP